VSDAPDAAPERLLDAAAQLVRERGADALTMQLLSERSGISRATIYRRVGGRAAIVRALALRGHNAARPDARAKIIAAARDVFARHGFELATIEQIANRAAVAEATVYRLFGDKEGLVSAFLSEVAPRRAAREIIERPSGDLRADLARFAERVLTAASESPELLRIVLFESLKQGSLVARIRAHSPARTLPALVSLLASHAHDGAFGALSAHDAAQSFMGMVMAFGLLGPVMHGLSVPPPKETALKITSLFLDGALASTRTSHAKPVTRARQKR
jgi:AcrR family transcriptional regulator